MTTPNEPELLAVIQEDREAARDWMLHNFPWSMDSRAARRQLEKAFARHRLDTRPTPAAVGDVEGLRAALRELMKATDFIGSRVADWERMIEDAKEQARAALAQPQPSGGVDEARRLLAEEAGLSADPNDPESLSLDDRDQVFTEDALRAIQRALSNPPSEEMTR